MKHSKIAAVVFSLGLMLSCISVAHAEDGVTGSEILLGQSCALEGPAQALGIGMKTGMEVYFAQNPKVGNRAIKLLAMDDGYEPIKAVDNTKKLIEESKVFLMIGGVGTPTAKAIVPVTKAAKVPFFGPFTGAGFLREPENLTINIRGSYDQEMEKLAEYLVDTKKLTKIACFYQNDGYGQVGLSGITKALKKRNMELVSTGSYERNTLAIKKSLRDISKGAPEAVVMVGAYAPCAEFIKEAKQKKLADATFCNISFVGSKALMEALGADGEGVIISQVVNFPWDETVPLVKEYAAAMRKQDKADEIGFITLEGYMVAKLFCMAAEKAGEDLTRESLLKAIYDTKTFDLGGVKLTFSPSDHQGMDEIFLTIINGDKINPIKE